MACERCGSPDAPAALYALKKGGGTMRREFCDKCAEITAAVYPLREIRRLREAPAAEPEGQAPEPAEEADPEAAEAAEPEGQAPEAEPEGEAEPSPEERQSTRRRPRRE